MINIALVGRIDPSNHLVDGQTVKTRTLYQELEKNPRIRVYSVDTDDYRHHIIRVFLSLLHALFHCKKIILIVSNNGRKFFFPLMYWINKFFSKDIYHDAIGGRLAKELVLFPKWKKYLNSFQSNWVESRIIVRSLSELGVDNAVYIPNFKEYAPIKPPQSDPYNCLKFCTFSRVTEKKGIEDAMRAIDTLNSQFVNVHFSLDIYGPIDREFSDKFQALLDDYTCARYCGVVDPSDAANVIANYRALLFPTRWLGEGMPGTILDSLYAGTPVIASRWKYYDEMLVDGITGFSYPISQPQGLNTAITKLLELSHEQYKRMRNDCKEYSMHYSTEHCMALILDQLHK